MENLWNKAFNVGKFFFSPSCRLRCQGFPKLTQLLPLPSSLLSRYFSEEEPRGTWISMWQTSTCPYSAAAWRGVLLLWFSILKLGSIPSTEKERKKKIRVFSQVSKQGSFLPWRKEGENHREALGRSRAVGRRERETSDISPGCHLRKLPGVYPEDSINREWISIPKPNLNPKTGSNKGFFQAFFVFNFILYHNFILCYNFWTIFSFIAVNAANKRDL